MSSQIIIKALGLNKSPNALEAQPGSLTVASNVIIKRDSVIEPRRGYKLYGDDFGSASDTAKQLAVYKDRILRHYSNKLQYDTMVENSDGESVFNSFNGTYLEPETGRRIRFLEQNSNLYFTSDEGIKKISAKIASDLTTTSGFITQAGGVKAIDVSSRLNITLGAQSSFFDQDSAVAYRIVWGIRDLNNNLILGTPSQRTEIYNPLLSLLLIDYMKLLGALDYVSNYTTTSLISDANYVNTLKLTITASASDLRTNLISLSSKIDNDLLYANDTSGAPLTMGATPAAISGGVCTITFSSGNPTNYFSAGNKIYLSGFSPASGTLNDSQTIATVTATTLTFSTSASGGVTTSTATIVGNNYRSITQPSAPSDPTTDAQLVAIQTYLDNIIIQLQSEPTTGSPATIDSTAKSTFITPLDITTTSTVILNISIPQDITTDYFYQIYRSDQALATDTLVLSTDVFPNDEMKLVYEAYPTSTDISNGYIEVEDITPDDFRGAYLYTNEQTGEGILQANDIPPFALDINKFKNYTFFANTRTRHRELLNLLGVSNMVTDYGLSTTPTITITNGTRTKTYTFVTGRAEITSVTCTAGSTLVNTAAPASYFLLNSANDLTSYYVWYKIGSAIDPAVSGKTGIMVLATAGDTNAQIAQKTRDAIAVYLQEFTTSVTSNTLTITNVTAGYTTNASAGTSGFTITVTTQGRGENITNREILLSTLTSPASAVDETARSFVHVLNRTSGEATYVYYLSGAQDVPGKMLLEERGLSGDPFYIIGNNSNTGESFNPDISPALTISSISVANPTVITTSISHGLSNMDQVVITNTNSTPHVDGLYTITYLSSTTFSINENVTISGNRGSLSVTTSTVTSDNEDQPHRIYYSKLLQPESVPLINYFDVGAQDKAILRIFPLRDSLFVFKEDGLFRVSGEVSPFTTALFDSSAILVAPDSLDVSNNLLYGWGTQGIVSVSESGVNIISRPIDVDILVLQSAQYTNFSTVTWGIGYESDNSYTVYTVQFTDDTVAQIGYRYSTLTNTWTTFDKSATCGVINKTDDKQYLGAGDTNYIEQERKNFNRLDYADRQFIVDLTTGNYFDDQLKFSTVSSIAVGDVLVQNQLVTTYHYNNLLTKLDNDVNLSPHNYFSTLEAVGGDNLRDKVDDLLDKIANDPGRLAQAGATSAASYTAFKTISGTKTITAISASDPTIITSTTHGLQTGRMITTSGSNSSPLINNIYQVTVINANTFSVPVSVTTAGTTGSFNVLNENFTDIKTSFNGMITLLNNDAGVAFSNYMSVNTETPVEAIVTEVNTAINKVTLNLTLDFVVGDVTVYKAIESEFEYVPTTINNWITLKQFSESTFMFQNRLFTELKSYFASDLLPEYKLVTFTGSGNGIFGFTNFGSGFFGGVGNSAPMRTLIPAEKQRCRFLLIKVNHKIAREFYSLYGITISGNDTGSTRGYR